MVFLVFVWNQGDPNKEAFFLSRCLFSLKTGLPVQDPQREGKYAAVAQTLYMICLSLNSSELSKHNLSETLSLKKKRGEDIHQHRRAHKEKPGPHQSCNGQFLPGWNHQQKHLPVSPRTLRGRKFWFLFSIKCFKCRDRRVTLCPQPIAPFRPTPAPVCLWEVPHKIRSHR